MLPHVAILNPAIVRRSCVAVVEDGGIRTATADAGVSFVSTSAVRVDVKEELRFALVFVTSGFGGHHNASMSIC